MPGNEVAVTVRALPSGTLGATSNVVWNVPSVASVIRRMTMSGRSREIVATSVSVTGTEAGAVPSTTIPARPFAGRAVSVSDPLAFTDMAVPGPAPSMARTAGLRPASIRSSAATSEETRRSPLPYVGASLAYSTRSLTSYRRSPGRRTIVRPGRESVTSDADADHE